MAVYNVNDLVDVRSNKTHTWRAGTVTSTTAGAPPGCCYEVTLDAPISANDWSGAIRKYGGTDTLTKVRIFKQAELVAPGELIRTQGG